MEAAELFDPGLKIGETLKNSDIVEKFKCGNMGGMRRSKTTNTLVIVSDYTKGIYHDKWIGGVLHYTGMGKSGDQDINWAQNATLAACGITVWMSICLKLWMLVSTSIVAGLSW